MSELSSGRGIKKHNEFILMGKKLIEEFLKNPNFKVKGEIIYEELKSLTTTASLLKGQKIPVFKLPKSLFNEIDVIGTHYNLLVPELKSLEQLNSSASSQGLEVICPLGGQTKEGQYLIFSPPPIDLRNPPNKHILCHQWFGSFCPAKPTDISQVAFLQKELSTLLSLEILLLLLL